MAQQFSADFGPGRDPGDPVSVPHQGPCMEPASLSACVSASVCVCVSLMPHLTKRIGDNSQKQ